MEIGVINPKESLDQKKVTITAKTCLEVIAEVDKNKDFYGKYATIMIKNAMVNTAKELNQNGYNFQVVEVSNSGIEAVYHPNSEDLPSNGDILTIDKLIEIADVELANETTGYSSDG